MSRLVAKISSSMTKEQFQSALARDKERKAVVSCFLIGAKRENLMFNGRSALSAYEAFCELMGYDPAALEEKLYPSENGAEP